jgi:Type VI secretion system/phage-baseplate injector OB domain
LVPSVFGGDKETAWALPSVLYAGNGVGFVFIPPIGTNVGIELVIQILLSGLAAFWESGKHLLYLIFQIEKLSKHVPQL